mgnify:FL=1|jgi:hypothetical protein
MRDDPEIPHRSSSDGRLRPTRGQIGSVGVVVLTIVVVSSLVVGSLAVGSQTASAQASPQTTSGFSSAVIDLNVFAPDNTLTPGQTDEMMLQISNNARIQDSSEPSSIDTTTTARNVRVEVNEQSAPVTVETGRQSVGNIGTAVPKEVPIAIDVPEDAEAGEYTMEVELEYRQIGRLFDTLGTQNDRSYTVTREVDIVIDDSARFELRDAGTEAQIGDDGPMTVEVENIGGEPAEDLTVELASASGRIQFGGSNTEVASLGSLEPGETALIDYEIGFGADASVREYPLDATVTFENPEGINEEYETRFNLTPQAQQTFEIENVESTLRVGEEGNLIGTVQNTGPVTANSVVVRYHSDAANLVPIESEFAVGTLAPSESAEFRLPIEVTREAEALPRSVDLSVQYRNLDNELRAYQKVDALAEVDQRRDRFLISIEDKELTAGESRRLEVEVTNNLNQSVTDVDARLFTEDPLNSDNDEGYIESLAPGESTTIVFELNAGGSATAKTYPISFDFQYNDADGRSKLSDTSQVAMTITESEGGSSSLSIIGVIAVIAMVGTAIGAVAYIRRRE